MTPARREAFDKIMQDRDKILENLSDETRRKIGQAVHQHNKKTEWPLAGGTACASKTAGPDGRA